LKATVLVIDDERLLLDSLNRALSREGYHVLAAVNGREALAAFEENFPDLVLLDVKLPDADGIQLLQKFRQRNPRCPVIIMTAYSGIKGAVEAIKQGAYDYIAKPFDIDALKILVARCLEARKVQAEVHQIRTSNKERYRFKNIITTNSRMREIIKLAQRVAANSRSTVLILGESGTGKELIANAIHYHGSRADYPLVTINCAVLSEGVLESELFGHEKGAFTGAIRQKKGLFELADQGTLFLDEIGEISPRTQIKLLRFLEEKEFQRVGGTRSIKVDLRIIAATNKDLLRKVEEGKFREDLYYRLNVISTTIPPLRERREDIPLLARHFVEKYSRTLNKPVKGFSKEALRILTDYHWPGNVRELKNIIERVVLLSDGEIIASSDIPSEIFQVGTAGKGFIANGGAIQTLDVVISRYVKEILDRYRGNRSRAADALGITRQRLRRILGASSKKGGHHGGEDHGF
jgi:DNA-binding NtrC family response regulator